MEKQPLKILHLASHPNFQRGGAVQMARLAGGLARRGHRVAVWLNAPQLPDASHPLMQALHEAGVELKAFDQNAPDAEEDFARAFDAKGFQVLHCHRQPAMLFADAALGATQPGAFIAQRGTIYQPPWFSREHRVLWGRRCDRVIVVAHAVKRSLCRGRLIPPGKVEVVYGGVDLDQYRPELSGQRLLTRLHVANGTRVITLPGALVTKKGVDDFLKAADHVRRQRQGVEFWIAGRGKHEEQLKALAESLELGAMVRFLGHVDAMPELYAASDLVVCAATKGEGLTGTLREALAMERPVVTTNVAGNTELVEEGVTGYVAKINNPPSLADAILRALNDPNKTKRLARAGRERVIQWSDENKRSERVETIYREILAKNGFSCAGSGV